MKQVSFILSRGMSVLLVLALMATVSLYGCKKEKPEPRIEETLLDPLVNDAANNFMMGHYYEAETQYRKIKMIHEDTLGKDHPANADDLGRIAASLEGQKRFDDAERTYNESIAIYKKFGDEYQGEIATTYTCLGLMYKKMGKDKDAEKYLLEALALNEKVLGSDSADLSYDIENLITFYTATNQADKAMSLEERLKRLKPSPPANAAEPAQEGGHD